MRAAEPSGTRDVLCTSCCEGIQGRVKGEDRDQRVDVEPCSVVTADGGRGVGGALGMGGGWVSPVQAGVQAASVCAEDETTTACSPVQRWRLKGHARPSRMVFVSTLQRLQCQDSGRIRAEGRACRFWQRTLEGRNQGRQDRVPS